MARHTDAIQISVSNRRAPSLYAVSDGALVAALINTAVQGTLE